jgi:hypothetical protein
MDRRPADDRHKRAKDRITGRIIAAGRALVGVGTADMAAACGLPVERMAILEAKGSAWVRSKAEVAAIKRGLDHYGVVIIPESDHMGKGVRLKFTRSDVRQIARLEGEGGLIGSDDAP